MAKGLLRVTGTIRLNQFWPAGESDADTAKVLVGPKSFEFRSAPNQPFRTTHVFENALVKGGAQPPKAPISKKGELTIRWQGIDAEELHYRPAPLSGTAITQEMRDRFKAVNHEYRQHWGESAPLALGKFLEALGQDPVPCIVESAVDHPNDVFDVYGRLVGDIFVTVKGKRVNVNNWLLTQGWATPAFYASMSKAEINAKLKCAAEGAQRGATPDVTGQPVPFDFALVYRSGKTVPHPEIGEDRGRALMPKVYRRQTTWTCQKKAEAPVPKEFDAYLKDVSKDTLYLTEDFLKRGTKAAQLTLGQQFENGILKLRPQDMVFEEKSSTLIDAKTKQPITNWFPAAGKAGGQKVAA